MGVTAPRRVLLMHGLDLLLITPELWMRIGKGEMQALGWKSCKVWSFTGVGSTGAAP